MEDKTPEEATAESEKNVASEGAEQVEENAAETEGAAMHEEEAAECDIDDPFAMMGGMGEEEVYKVTLMEDKTLEEATAESKETGVLEGVERTEEQPAQAQEKHAIEQEVVGCDCDDPFAMMGGMGEEEVYKVTLMEDKVAQDNSAETSKSDVSEAAKQIEDTSQASSTPPKKKKKTSAQLRQLKK